MDEYVSIQQVAEIAQVQAKTVRDWIAAERIETYIKGDRRRQYIRRDDAEYLVRPRIVQRRTADQPAAVRG